MRQRITAMLFLAGLLQAVGAVDEELRFVRELTTEGFPDLARIVLDRAVTQGPVAEAAVPELRIRILIAEKKYAEARCQIASVPDPSLLWLFLADTARRAHALPEAEAAYREWLALPGLSGDAAAEAAFYYGEMLEARGELKAARALYEKILSLPKLGAAARPIQTRLASLLRTSDPARARRLCEQVQLGGLDLWFGQAVAIWAEGMLAQGEREEAQAVLETQLELLRQIEEALAEQGAPVSHLSPLADARFLLGLCYEQAGRPADALHQFYNVYVRYGDSPRGPTAKEKSQALIAAFEAQGKTVQIDLGAQRARLEESRFRVARRLSAEGREDDAEAAWLDALAEAPEGDGAVAALRELLCCLIRQRDPLSVEAVATHLGERFSGRDGAPEALLAVGRYALDERQSALARRIYERYFTAFPHHPQAPGVLLALAELRRQARDTAGEEEDLERVVRSWPDAPAAVRALGRLAWSACEQERFAVAAERFERYLRVETDAPKQQCARFAQADCFRRIADWSSALEKFQALEAVLSAEGGGNEPTLLEKSVFQQWICLTHLGQPAAAAQGFERFLQTFATSPLRPQVQGAYASALAELQRWPDVLSALEGIEACEDRAVTDPALLLRGRALFESGQVSAAIQTLETLLAQAPTDALLPEIRLLQGRALAAAGRSQEAVAALGEALGAAADDLLVHRVGLELGRAQTDPAEKLASFQRVALLADPSDPAQAALIQQALCESLPLYLELGRPRDVLADSDRLLREFPTLGERDQIDRLRAQAEKTLEQSS
jgi:tetratricopeptide (TPR) repeat protein